MNMAGCDLWLQVSPDRKTASTWCSGGGMVEPNDLALSKQGWLYVSGQRWTDDTAVGDGGVWLCKGPGKAQQLFLTGRTNGIELSPDEK
jgi:sugar lactone lactonase YvrE